MEGAKNEAAPRAEDSFKNCLLFFMSIPFGFYCQLPSNQSLKSIHVIGREPIKVVSIYWDLNYVQ